MGEEDVKKKIITILIVLVWWASGVSGLIFDSKIKKRDFLVVDAYVVGFFGLGIGPIAWVCPFFTWLVNQPSEVLVKFSD
jgi:hypothetical protein